MNNKTTAFWKQSAVGENLELLGIDMENPVQSKALCELVNYFQIGEVKGMLQIIEKGDICHISDAAMGRLAFLESKKF